jgi:hypothetical protein
MRLTVPGEQYGFIQSNGAGAFRPKLVEISGDVITQK